MRDGESGRVILDHSESIVLCEWLKRITIDYSEKEAFHRIEERGERESK